MAGLSGLERRHFNAIAATLRALNPTDGNMDGAVWMWERTCQEFADRLAADNERFDTDKFLKACDGP